MVQIIATGPVTTPTSALSALRNAVEQEMGKGLTAKYGDGTRIYVEGSVSPNGHAIVTSMKVEF